MKKAVRMIIDVLAIISLLFLDQYTKYLAITDLKDQSAVSLIDGILELRYLENKGAAFGMLQNKKALFIFMTVVMLTVIFYVFFKLPQQKKFIIWQVFMCLICAGGIGNMIDRIRFDYVVDFIYFKIIDFPVFNVADIMITIGTVLFFIVVLFFVKEEELQFLRFNIRREE
ncbi:MAG: signal peptidase II [Lachnospiraceae bacterium]|nr:signal peptidase II [Lachnospiraceae bacterium]